MGLKLSCDSCDKTIAVTSSPHTGIDVPDNWVQSTWSDKEEINIPVKRTKTITFRSIICDTCSETLRGKCKNRAQQIESPVFPDSALGLAT